MIAKEESVEDVHDLHRINSDVAPNSELQYSVVILGGAGYIGKLLCKELCKRKYERIIVIDVKEEMNFSTLGMNVEYHTLDIVQNVNQFQSILTNVNRVYYCVNSSKFSRNIYCDAQIIIDTTMVMIESCVKMNVDSIFYISNCFCVFDGNIILEGDEYLPYIHQNSKGANPLLKAFAYAEEKILKVHGCLLKKFGGMYSPNITYNDKLESDVMIPIDPNKTLKTVAIRIPILFGNNGYSEFGIESYLISNLLKCHKSKYFIANKDKFTDFLHIKNLVDFLVKSSELYLRENKIKHAQYLQSIGGQAYNITNDHPLKFYAFLSNLAGKLGYERPYISIPNILLSPLIFLSNTFSKKGIHLYSYNIDFLNYHTCFSLDRIKKVFIYSPAISMQRGFNETIQDIIDCDNDIKLQYNITTKYEEALRKACTTNLCPVLYNDNKLIATPYFKYTSMFTPYNLALQGPIINKISRLLLKSVSVITPILYLIKIFIPTSNYIYRLLPKILAHTTNTHMLLITAAASGIAYLLKTYLSSSSILQINDTKLSVIPHCVSAFFGDNKNFDKTSLEKFSYNDKYAISTGILKGVLNFLPGPLSMTKQAALLNFGTFSTSIFHQEVVYLSGDSAVKFFFSLKDDVVEIDPLYNICEPIFGKGILYDAGTVKKQEQMHMLSACLSDKYLNNYYETFIRILDSVYNTMPENGKIDDIKRMFDKITTMTATASLIGEELVERSDEIAMHLTALDGGLCYITALWRHAPIAAHIERNYHRAKLSDIISDAIHKKRQAKTLKKERSATGNFDALDLLLEMKYEDGTKFTDYELVSLIILLLFAGQHTSNITTTWLFINILHQGGDCFRQIIEEQSKFDKLELDDLTNKCNILASCFLESLRLHPPLANLGRLVSKTLMFEGHTFAPGTILLVNLHETGKQHSYLNEGNTFKHDRWIGQDFDQWKKEYKYVMFGAGKHSCMGRRFAQAQIKTIVSYFLRNCKFEPISTVIPQDEEFALVVSPHECYPLYYKKLHNNSSPGKRLQNSQGYVTAACG